MKSKTTATFVTSARTSQGTVGAALSVMAERQTNMVTSSAGICPTFTTSSSPAAYDPVRQRRQTGVNQQSKAAMA